MFSFRYYQELLKYCLNVKAKTPWSFICVENHILKKLAFRRNAIFGTSFWSVIPNSMD